MSANAQLRTLYEINGTPGGEGVALVVSRPHRSTMHITTAYHRREALSADELIRLRAALVEEVERYRAAIRGYSAEKMQKHGAPFLADLEGRVEDVDRILSSRGAVAE